MTALKPRMNRARTYNLKLPARLSSVLLLPLDLLRITFGGAVVWVGVRMVINNMQNLFTPDGLSPVALVMLFLIPILIIIPLGLFFLVAYLYVARLRVGRTFLSYVKVSPDGLEVCSWPTYHARCHWLDVQRSNSFTWNASHLTITLKNAEVLDEGARPSILQRFPLLSTSKDSDIYLSQYQGYPDGALAKDLRRYAPHLFDIEI